MGTITSTDERWLLPASGYAPGVTAMASEYTEKVHGAIFRYAEQLAEERAPDGPIVVTIDDMKRAIENYEV